MSDDRIEGINLAAEWAVRKIERLEAELAECQNLLSLNARPVDMARELADLRASSVVYKVRCDYCWIDGKPNPLLATEDCSECDNGWQLAEGVRKITPAVKVYDKIIGDYVFPARLIEGESDE